MTMVEYPNVQFVVSDGSIGSGCVDFDNGTLTCRGCRCQKGVVHKQSSTEDHARE